MSYLRRIEIRDPYYVPSLFFPAEPLSFPPLFALEEYDDGIYSDARLLNLVESVTDLIDIQKTPSFSSYRRIRRLSGAHSHLLALNERVSALESKFDRLANAKKIRDRKYTWTTEIKDKETERKYKFAAEIGGGKKEEKHHHHHLEQHKKKTGKKNYKWTAEIKEKGEKGPITRTYTWQASTEDVDGGSEPEKKEKKKKKKKKKEEKFARIVEIEEPSDHGAVVLRHAFSKRAGAIRAAKGKKKELNVQDAAMLIQMSFKAYLVRRSRALRSLRELAVAKSKLKEIRVLFNNFSYRRRIVHDAEERQRFSERIIVLLLTVEAIEGADLMVRLSKRSMVGELEAMLEVVDPQQPPTGGKSVSLKRRTFDVPDGVIQKEIAEGVTQIVRMLEEDEEEEGSTAASDEA